MSKLSECMAKARLAPDDADAVRQHANTSATEADAVRKFIDAQRDDLESLRVHLADQGHDLSVRTYAAPKPREPGKMSAPPQEVVAPPPAEVAKPPVSEQPQEPAASEGETKPASPKTFKTAMGSEYQIHDDGTTTRNKAYRAEHGEKEQGPQPKSEATFYVTPDQAEILGEIQTQGSQVGRAIEPLGDGRWGVKYTSGPDAGKFEKRTVVTPEKMPTVGATPVELWEGGKKVHFGNEITALDGGPEVVDTSSEETAKEAVPAEVPVETAQEHPEPSAGKEPEGGEAPEPPDSRSEGGTEPGKEGAGPAGPPEDLAPAEHPEDTTPPAESGGSDSGDKEHVPPPKYIQEIIKRRPAEGRALEIGHDVVHNGLSVAEGLKRLAEMRVKGEIPEGVMRVALNRFPDAGTTEGEVQQALKDAKAEGQKPSEKGSVSLFDEPVPEKPEPLPEVKDVRGARDQRDKETAVFNAGSYAAAEKSFPGLTRDEYSKLRAAARDRPAGVTGRKAQAESAEPVEKEQPKERGPIGDAVAKISDRVKTLIETHAPAILDIAENARMMMNPMSSGSDVARSTAKDFANAQRMSRYEWSRVHNLLSERFTPEQRKRMWEAADEQSVLEQQGKKTKGKGLDTLAPDERAAVESLQKSAQQTYDLAKKAGMIEGDGLPSYVPRMVVDMSTGKAVKNQAGESSSSLDAIGKNLRTTTSQLLNRKHLTVEETEKAARAKFGDNVGVVRDIRTLAMATGKLQDAIAGRTLINKIRQIGRQGGEMTVSDGGIPSPTTYRWFTIDHPAMSTWRPKMETMDGKTTPLKDEHGNMVFEKAPLYIRSDFEGPLRAVLSTQDGRVYRALMDLKARAMSVIMYSPLIHNGVEWGRALAAMPGKVATFKIYFEGNAAKNDPVQMRQAIDAGLVPIGARYGFQDISSITEEPSLVPGRSFTSKVLAFLPGLIDERAGTWTKETVDKMGDIWHNKLLWDRVADLQMGLYTNFRDNLVAKGTDALTAQRLAAHLANRYAGALPVEAMSAGARKLGNIALFSRSFTLGNLGAMKDAVAGMPSDVKAQVMRDGGQLATEAAKSYVRKKSQAVIALDIALNYLSTAAFSSGVAVLLGNTSVEDEAFGYLKRLQALVQKGKENALDLLNPMEDMLALTPQSENEPGKEGRVYVGRAADGSGIYMRLPMGKIGEEFEGWLTKPLEQLKNKLSTIARPLLQTVNNDKGFGRPVYDPYDKAPGSSVRAIGNVVQNFFSDQIPTQAIDAVKNLITGEGDKTMNLGQALGPLAGVTLSKGAPGGPEMGEYYADKKEHDTKVQMAMPDIRKKIKAGDRAGAMQDMTELGIPPRTQASYMRSTLTPRQAPSPQQLAAARRYTTPEQKARMQMAAEKNRELQLQQ